MIIEVPGHGQVEFPDDMTEDQIVSAIKTLPKPTPTIEDLSNPAADMSTFERLAASYGGAIPRLGRGLMQLIDPSEERKAEEAEMRRLEGPLLNTTAGKVGNFAGSVAATIPAAFIPGANTYAGATALGAGMGLLQPTVEGESKIANAIIGGAAGAAGKFAGDKISSGVQAFNDKARATMAARQAQNAVRDGSLVAGQKAGYVVPPSVANPSVLNRVIEGIPGKAGIAQGASLKNQEVTNSLAKKALGMSDDTPITEESLKALRAEAGKAYQVLKEFPGRFRADTQFADDIARIGADFSEAANEFPELVKNDAIEALKTSLNKQDIGPKATVELIKKLRFDATKNLKSFDDPAKAALGQAQRSAADALDGLIERNLTTSNPGAAQAYKQARTLIAKSYDVEAALNESTGNVSAKALAKTFEKGRPMTGDLETIARFGSAFPKATQNVEPLSGVLGGTPLDWAMGAGASIGMGNPAYLAAAAARPAIRAGVLTPIGQKLLARPPSYGLPITNQALGLLQDPIVQQAIRSAGTVGMLNGGR